MKRSRYSLRVFSYSALRLFPVKQLNYKQIHNRCSEKPNEGLCPNGHIKAAQYPVLIHERAQRIPISLLQSANIEPLCFYNGVIGMDKVFYRHRKQSGQSCDSVYVGHAFALFPFCNGLTCNRALGGEGFLR